MSKVFRHHTIAAANNMNGWGLSTEYNSAIINDMQDPAGASASAEITSIPSPFARMALVKAAFGWVNNSNLDGNTIHHKMVSHCLDIGQIFFNYDNYKESGEIKIIKWDTSRARELMQATSYGNQLLGRTLELFLSQDADTYNFGDLHSIYLLQYTGEGHPSPLTIIGATSPVTLFVTPANNMNYIKGHICWGSHDALQSDPNTFQPLYQRDPDFIVWLFAMRKAYPNFTNMYREFSTYMDETFKRLPQNLKNKINAIQSTTYSTNYLQIELSPGVPVEIANFAVRKKQKLNIASVSAFSIAATKPVMGDIPLALPNGLFTQPWRYVTDQWDQRLRTVEDNRQLESRTLPGDGTKWPYLTIHDFLESTIVEMDTNVVNTDFFDGNLEDKTTEQEGTGYLLPIKRRYFDYFTPEDLKNNLKLVVENIAGGGKYVKAILSIPVSGGNIVYEKSYMPFKGVNDGSGLIDRRDFTMALFPCTKFTASTNPDYRIMFMSLNKNWEPVLTCYNDNGSIEPHVKDDRNTDTNNSLIDTTAPTMPVYAIDQQFDYIELAGNGISGIAIPMWRGNAGGSTFHFAVDFGTTNTHIEYRIDNGNAKPLDITSQQLALLNSDAERSLDYRIPLFNTVIPKAMGTGTEVQFPMRTVLYYEKGTNWHTAISPYVTGNMPFYYGTHKRGRNNDIEYNLKWSNADGNIERIKCYLGSLMLLMRNKVVMEGGNLTNTTITWFYPTSMANAMVARIQRVWNELFASYFGGNTNQLKSIPESIAPYEFYKKNFGAGVDVLTIDIGGGTSDAMIVDHNGQPAYVTSFRFAANSLFGDAFADGNINLNGFVRHFRPKIDAILAANNLDAPRAIMDEVAANQPAVDLISFFFTLKDNIDVKNAKIEQQLDFLNMMSNSEEAKTLMLVFYTSIVYHLAMFIKAKKDAGNPVGVPAYLAFSGNGSKLLQVLGAGTEAGTAMLSDYTMAIFEKVMGERYPNQTIAFVTDYKSPKEATSRGGLDTVTVPSPNELSKMVQTFLGTRPDHFVESTEQYSDLKDEDWEELCQAIDAFTQIFFDLAKEKDVENNFGTIPYASLVSYKPLFSANITTGTRSALSYLGLLNQPVRIENTLFFYPITNIIHNLAQKILK